MLKDKAIAGYLAYAIGEIALVIIGILLGLSLNKWNEERKARSVLESEFKVVAEDLRRDTTEAQFIIKYFRDIEPQIDSLLEGTASEETLDRCEPCWGFVTSAQPFFVERRGYELLGKYADDITFHSDSLLSEIIQFYSDFIQLNEINYKMLIENTSRNIYTWQDKYPWFSKTLGPGARANDDFIHYVFHSTEYQNMVSFRRVLIYQNFIPLLEAFSEQAAILLKQIEERVS